MIYNEKEAEFGVICSGNYMLWSSRYSCILCREFAERCKVSEEEYRKIMIEQFNAITNPNTNELEYPTKESTINAAEWIRSRILLNVLAGENNV